MCLIGFALDAHDEFALLMAANRDEMYARASDAATWWADRPGVWGGRDRVAGGSWLAVDRRGRLAAVTNVREPGVAPGRRSRGELVADFVATTVPIEDYAARIAARGNDYAGFNLILFDPSSPHPALYVSNRHPQRVLRIAPGVHGLSNHLLDSDWPKVHQLNQRLRDVLADPRQPINSVLLRALADRSVPSDAALPDTGVGLARERILGPAMIFAPGLGYGTRASTLLAVRRDGRVDVLERNWLPDESAPRVINEQRVRFRARPIDSRLLSRA